MTKFLTLIALSLIASASMAAETKYYYGDFMYFGADGVTSLGKTVSLVARTISPENNNIIEDVYQPATPGAKPGHFVTHLDRTTDNLFSTYDDNKTFSGTVTFTKGEEWKWTEWSYDISVQGGKLKGSGKLSKEGIETDKVFYKGTEVVMKIRENLAEINQKKYEKLKKEMTKPAK